MPGQTRRAGVIDIYGGEMQRRGEPNFAWKSIVSATMNLPGVRGVWPMSSFVAGGNAVDVSGQNRTLTYNGDPDYDYEGLIPFIDLDGTGDYLSRTDEAGLDILGAEGYVANNKRGLSLGGWFRFDRLTTAEYLIAKWSGASDSYRLIKTAGDNISFRVEDGAGVNFAVTSTGTVSTGEWYHLYGVFDPNTLIGVYIDDAYDQNVAAPVASIRNGNADFTIGSLSGGGSYLQGDASICWLCAMYHERTVVIGHYEHTRVLYGK